MDRGWHAPRVEGAEMRVCSACGERKRNREFYRRPNGRIDKRCIECESKRKQERPVRIGVISDTHFGSRYAATTCVAACVRDMHDRGARRILHCGDLLDGCYDHSVHERVASSPEGQVAIAIDTLPEIKGLRYYAITGNHDLTFSRTLGGSAAVGRYIELAFRGAGRRDLSVVGANGAVVEHGGKRIHVWHPKSRPTKMKSTPLQNQIWSYAPARKPAILLAGHWHTYCHVAQRGVEGFAVPCFQYGGSAFGHALGGGPVIGGMLLDLTHDHDLGIRLYRYRDDGALETQEV